MRLHYNYIWVFPRNFHVTQYSPSVFQGCVLTILVDKKNLGRKSTSSQGSTLSDWVQDKSHYYIKSSILYEQSKNFGFRSQYFHLNQCSRNPSVIFDILNSLTGKMMMLPELQSGLQRTVMLPLDKLKLNNGILWPGH